MSNPRNINLLVQGSAATAKAQLPGIPAVRTDDKWLSDTLNAMKERLELLEGSRKNPFERAITLRDLDELGLVRTGPSPSGLTATSGAIVQTPDGQFVLMSFDALAAILASK